MFQRKQQQSDDSSKHWYQDKYQHVLVQRNMLAILALVALGCAFLAVLAVMHFAPLKSVEPYLLQIDDKTGITQKVDPVSRDQYAASEAIDRYFTALYIRTRESYNFSILRSNYNQVRLMSAPQVFYAYRAMLGDQKTSPSVVLGTNGMRDVRINSMSYITNPPLPGKKAEPVSPEKIMQVRLTTTDHMPNMADAEQRWVITITFAYASIDFNETDQLSNPIGYTVTSYQMQREV